MNNIFNDTRSMVFSGVSGAILFGINFLPATLLTGLGGGSAIGAIWGAITAPFILCTCVLITKKYGAATITYVVYAICAIPTLVMGPPHLLKPVQALLAGLSFELGMLILGGIKNRSLYSGFTLFTIVSLILYVQVYKLLELPGLDRLMSGIYIFALVFWVIGLIGVYLSTVLYKRIKDDPRIASFHIQE